MALTGRLSQDLYRELLSDGLPVPLGHQPWWLDAAAGADNWDAAVTFRGTEVSGVLPFTKSKKKGLRILGQPPLSVGLGPLTIGSALSPYGRLSQEFEAIDSLFDQLPGHDIYHQRWHYRQRNWQPLYWRGYRQSTGYSYVMPASTSLNDLWKELHGNVRKSIRKAEGRFGVKVRDGDPSELFGLVLDTFAVQGLGCPFSVGDLRRLFSIADRQGAGEILIAEDGQGRLCAGGFFVFDGDTTWYLVGGDHAELRTTGAMSCVLWEAISRASNRGTAFDFEGSMLRGVERFFRTFGGEPAAYSVVSGSPTRRGQLGLWRLGVGIPPKRSRLSSALLD